MRRRSLIVVSLLTVFLSGCQWPGEKPSGAKDGYFTWVDEQGQVRQTAIPGSKASSDAEDSDEPIANPSGDDHPEFNLDNYPDGDAMAEQGYVRPGDPEPYFTWRDASGNVRVSYYRPDTRSAVEKGEIKPPLELTEASIYQAGPAGAANVANIANIANIERTDLPEGADSLAAAVLGLEDRVAPYFERWTAACCEDLDRSDHIDWESGREFGVQVTESASTHEFISGNSHYRLVRLPNRQQEGQKEGGAAIDDFILRLRSFDQKGMFVPSVAFLDAEFRPLRLVTDLVAEFVPESWSRHGYLRSYIPVFPSRGERWLLIYTRAEDIEDQTVIDTRYGPRAIPHQRTGNLGLVKVEN